MNIRKIEAQKQEVKKLRVAAYCRVSTDSDDQRDSLETQKQHFEAWIRLHSDWEYAGVFYDFGITGTKAEVRDGLQALLYECRIGRIDYVLTKSVSRFARNTVDCLSIVRELLSYGIPIYFEKENLDTGSMESELILSIISSLAQDESESISKNVKWSAQKRMENGSYKIGCVPYGYTKNEHGDMVIVPEEADVIQYIFNSVVSGMGVYKIAKNLNARHIPARKGGKWSTTTLLDILVNEKYVGDALFQKTYTDSNFHRHDNHGEMKTHLVQEHHEPIIPEELFLKVQEEIARRGSERDCLGKKRGFSSNHCFSQMVYCAECGEQFRRIHWNNRGKKSIVWRCTTRLHDKEKCRARTVSETLLQDAFLDAVNEMLGDSSVYLKRLKENLETAIHLTNPDSAEALAARMSALQQELIDRTSRRENHDDLAEEILHLREVQAQTVMDDAAKAEHKKRIRELRAFICSQPHDITEFDETLVKHLVERVTVFGDYLVFRLKSGVEVVVEK